MPRRCCSTSTESARAKVLASAELRRATLEQSADTIDAAAAAMSDRFTRGGRLFVFGNGGSSTDAASLAALFIQPPWGQPLPARNLVDDSAVLTALGNDVGFDLVFSRQLIAHAGGGRHRNRTVDQRQLAQPSAGVRRRRSAGNADDRNRRLLGRRDGRVADVQHCLVVNADSVHRIQETQAALGFALWRAVQARYADTQSMKTSRGRR